MNRLIFIPILLSLAVNLYFPATARVYVDDMDDTGVNNIKQYSNLMMHTFSGGPSSISSPSVFTFLDRSKPVAWAQYRVSGATSISAAVYTKNGLFVSQNPNGTFVLGMFDDNMDSSSMLRADQALFCPASNSVYTKLGGLKQMFLDSRGYVFGPVSTPPQSTQLMYGVNLYYSTDGTSFVLAPQTRTEVLFDDSISFYYEVYTASVPESAKYVRAEINDVTSVPYLNPNNGHFKKEIVTDFTMLSSVSISGDNLTLGEPEPVVSESAIGYPNEPIIVIIREESSKSSKSSSSEKDKPDESKPSVESQKSQSSKQSSASSKFEGTITSPSVSQRTNPSKSSSKQSSSSSVKSSAAEPPSKSEIPLEETVVYTIPKKEAPTRFNTAVTAYIIVVSGAITALIVLPKSK